MNVQSSPDLAVATALNSEITGAAELHKSTVMGSFGKVSATTGWKAFFRGEFFGHGTETELTNRSLFNNIALTHGQTIADKVGRQLGLSETSSKPINSYKAAKAVALVEAESDWTKVHTTNIQYTPVDKNGNSTGTPASYTVTLTPLGRLKSLAASRGLFGVSSTDINNENVVNGWVEQMHDSSSTTPTTNLLRSGMLVPPKAKSKDGAEETDSAKKVRTKTAMNRYTQTLSAIVEKNPHLIPANFEEVNNSENNPLKIEHAHIGLLSPNKKKESVMAQDQMEFIKNKVNEKSIQIDYINKDGTPGKLWVKPKVLYTNFSVQKAQKEKKSDPTQEEAAALTPANTPDAVTEQTLNHYLSKNSEIEKKIAVLHPEINSAHSNDLCQTTEWKLLEVVRELRSNRSQEGSSFYSYEFQTKYALLLNKCGIPTHVYCKSGKDRTSRFSEMSKMWAANPDLTLSKMTRAVRNIIKAFSFSGNKTVQRLCTGFSGNKQFKTYWRLVAGEKKDRTFGGWTHWLSAGSYSGWGASSIVKT